MTSFLPLKNLCTADGHIGHVGFLIIAAGIARGEGTQQAAYLQNPSPPLSCPLRRDFLYWLYCPMRIAVQGAAKAFFPQYRVMISQWALLKAREDGPSRPNSS